MTTGRGLSCWKRYWQTAVLEEIPILSNTWIGPSLRIGPISVPERRPSHPRTYIVGMDNVAFFRGLDLKLVAALMLQSS